VKINWFQVVIAILNVGAAAVALNQGNPKLAALMLVYMTASLILAIL